MKLRACVSASGSLSRGLRHNPSLAPRCNFRTAKKLIAIYRNRHCEMARAKRSSSPALWNADTLPSTLRVNSSTAGVRRNTERASGDTDHPESRLHASPKGAEAALDQVLRSTAAIRLSERDVDCRRLLRELRWPQGAIGFDVPAWLCHGMPTMQHSSREEDRGAGELVR